MITAVDTNILIDVLEPDRQYGPGSRDALRRCLQEGMVVACEVVWAEVATAYGPLQTQVVEALTRIGVEYSALNLEAALEAARCWQAHRNKGKGRDRIAADFLIGGHALVQGDRLLTRDQDFYRRCFSPLKVVRP